MSDTSAVDSATSTATQMADDTIAVNLALTTAQARIASSNTLTTFQLNNYNSLEQMVDKATR